MGVYDEPLYPWLAPEKAFIQQAIHQQKIVIGICLGAQLIAAVLGAKVYRNPVEEIGWFPVQIAPSLSQWLKQALPSELTVFHWHGDTFDLPETAVNHLSTAVCSHQLYTCGDRILGIQFHPEATPAAVQAMVDHEGDSLSTGPYVQDRETILGPGNYQAGNSFLQNLLTRLL
jgi:GMP synthase (glutamine-hydrolysing)